MTDPMKGGVHAPPRGAPLPGPQPNPGAGAAPAAAPAAPAAPPAAPAAGPPPVPVASPPGAAAPPAAAPPAAPGTPYAVFPTAEAFNDRVGRAARSTAQSELGMPLDQAKVALEAWNKQQDAAKKAADAELSELERERAARTEAEAKVTAAEETAAEARLDAHVLQLCNERGIRDWQYAKFRITRKLDELPETEELDEAKFLDDLVADPQARVALGVGVAPAAPTPATTTPAGGAPPGTPGGPPGQVPPNATPPAADAFGLDDDAWSKRKKALGIY